MVHDLSAILDRRLTKSRMNAIINLIPKEWYTRFQKQYEAGKWMATKSANINKVAKIFKLQPNISYNLAFKLREYDNFFI
jgi:hypothetical protein